VSVIDDLLLQRSKRRELDRRLAAVGYGSPRAGFHTDGCQLGLTPQARCTRREIAAGHDARRRARRGRLLYR
jgi:hypothetical protein